MSEAKNRPGEAFGPCNFPHTVLFFLKNKL